jgi:hypothetical protein
MARQDNDVDAQRLQRLRTGPSSVAVGEGEIDREIGVEFGRAAERFLRIVKHPANHVASLHDDRSEVGGEQRFILANQGLCTSDHPLLRPPTPRRALVP